MRIAPFKSFGRLYILIYFLTFLQPVYSQSELPIDEDPYLDPDGIEALSSNQGFSKNQGIIIGILYGLHPALVFSPALSLGYYNEPFAVGVEISDSDKLEFWSKQKKMAGTLAFWRKYCLRKIILRPKHVLCECL